MDEMNAVGEAIEALGGLTLATVKSGVSSATWVRWRQQGAITDPRTLVWTAETTGVAIERMTPERRRGQKD